MGLDYCNGDCLWNRENKTCVAKSVLGSSSTVSCGAHHAPACNVCHKEYEHKYCNGECHWRNSACVENVSQKYENNSTHCFHH